MRDPHVAKLHYRLVPAKTVSFDQPPPVGRETEAFRVRLADDIVTFEMVEHHASEESARECVEPYLRAWELDAALRFGHPEISFEFRDADIIDRDPPPPGTGQVICAKAAIAAAAALSAAAHVSRARYPDPPEGFVVSPDVETMWRRYVGYLERRERLADMGYACLTVLKGSARGRDKAAKRYAISETVLRRLAQLTTEIGDEETARKFG
jgi:acyl-CoA synthetase (AMP-forming)/AMP-acid ligase II